MTFDQYYKARIKAADTSMWESVPTIEEARADYEREILGEATKKQTKKTEDLVYDPTTDSFK